MTTFMTTFDELIGRAAEHSEREAGLPGRADPAPCKGCAQAVVRQSVDWHGACGVPGIPMRACITARSERREVLEYLRELRDTLMEGGSKW